MRLITFHPACAHTLDYYQHLRELPAERFVAYQTHAAQSAARLPTDEPEPFPGAYAPERLVFMAWVAAVDGIAVAESLPALSVRLHTLGLTDIEVWPEIARTASTFEQELLPFLPPLCDTLGFDAEATAILRAEQQKRHLLAFCDSILEEAYPSPVRTAQELDDLLTDWLRIEPAYGSAVGFSLTVMQRAFDHLCDTLTAYGEAAPRLLPFTRFYARLQQVRQLLSTQAA